MGPDGSLVLVRARYLGRHGLTCSEGFDVGAEVVSLHGTAFQVPGLASYLGDEYPDVGLLFWRVVLGALDGAPEEVYGVLRAALGVADGGASSRHGG